MTRTAGGSTREAEIPRPAPAGDAGAVLAPPASDSNGLALPNAGFPYARLRLTAADMKTFHCTNCQSLVFFENVLCLNCKHALAYLPDRAEVAAVGTSADGLLHPIGMDDSQTVYRLCANHAQQVCNWAIPGAGTETLCDSCRLTRVIPNLDQPGNRVAWFKLELAKRRTVYTLLGLDLPVVPRSVDPASGLAFEFLQDAQDGDAKRVLTGHDNGLITVNIAEADDVYRERQRAQQHEPYRTLVGHFRHELGHYYWDRLIKDGPRLQAYRSLFGDERADYANALAKHYENGVPERWPEQFISAYATMHPWEDWAESWAHFLHMVDALETASAAGLTLEPQRAGEPAMPVPADPLYGRRREFRKMMASWFPLTYILNNLNRGLGLPDAYPFVLSKPVIAKLAFIHETILEVR